MVPTIKRQQQNQSTKGPKDQRTNASVSKQVSKQIHKQANKQRNHSHSPVTHHTTNPRFAKKDEGSHRTRTRKIQTIPEDSLQIEGFPLYPNSDDGKKSKGSSWHSRGHPGRPALPCFALPYISAFVLYISHNTYIYTDIDNKLNTV
jgi:hypothetical protein